MNLLFPVGNMLWLTGLAAAARLAGVLPSALACIGLGLGLAEAVVGPVALATGSTTLDNSWFSLAGLWVATAALTLGARHHPAPPGMPARGLR